MRNLLLLLSIASVVLWGSACGDASGKLLGGEALTSAPEAANTTATTTAPQCAVEGGTPRWQDLYPCYFSTCGTAGCHSSAGDTGSAFSGFVCGTTAESCATGITQSIGAAAPIVPKGGTNDPTTTGLWVALHTTNPVGAVTNNMPQGSTFTFNSGDLALIGAWIQDGAQNN